MTSMIIRLVLLFISFNLTCSSLVWAAAAIPKQSPAQKQHKMQQQQQMEQYQIMQEQQRSKPPAEVRPEDVKDVVDMSQLLEVLTKSSEAWSLIIDEESKIMVVDHF